LEVGVKIIGDAALSGDLVEQPDRTNKFDARIEARIAITEIKSRRANVPFAFPTSECHARNRNSQREENSGHSAEKKLSAVAPLR